MSDVVLTTLITSASMLLTAVIGTIGTYIAAKERARGDASGSSASPSCLLLALVAASSAFVGLIIGVVLSSLLVDSVPSAADAERLAEIIQPASAEQTQPPSSPPSSEEQGDVVAPASSRHQIYDDLDRLLGSDNWECLPGWPSAIGIREIPMGFTVSSPLIQVDSPSGNYQEGETVPAGYPGTGWLYRSLPDNPCPLDRPYITRSDLDGIFGAGNWSCLSGYREGIHVNSIPPYREGIHVNSIPTGYVVQSPVSVVDQWDIKYFTGDAVPSGSPATVWLRNYLDQDQCP